jgi:hypothetical protein
MPATRVHSTLTLVELHAMHASPWPAEMPWLLLLLFGFATVCLLYHATTVAASTVAVADAMQ